MLHSRHLFAALLVSIATLLPIASQAADNPRLYTANQSIEAAISFIGIPAGQHEKFRGSVKGRLPTAGAERALIDQLIRIDSDRSTALFLHLVGKSSLAELKAMVGNDGVVDRVVGSIADGSYLGVPPGARAFATVTDLLPDERAAYAGGRGVKMEPLPTATITVYTFDATRQRLIGTRFEVAAGKGGLTVSLPVFR